MERRLRITLLQCPRQAIMQPLVFATDDVL
jgi:hypothetical protein